MNIAVFPGSFDPVTLGHMDLIGRAASIFDHVYVCAMVNSGKNPMFTKEQRLAMLAAAVAELRNVTAELWTGLLTDYAKEKGARYLIKGVRNGTDFDTELGMAQINRALEPTLDTVLLPARTEFLHVSSTMVREMVLYRRPLEPYVPAAAIKIMERWQDDGKP